MTRLARIQPARQIIPLDIVAPGARGLNTVLAGQLMDSSYCTQALNCVIDTSGRLAARQGVATQTTTPISNVAITGEVIGTGNGVQTTFSGFLVNVNDVPSSITITAGLIVGTDNGSGTISGTGVSGTINYTTGSFFLTYSAAVGNGTHITANYSYTPQIQEIFEYNAGNSVYQTIISWAGGVSNSLLNPSGNSIAGTASVASGIWYFQNFNNKMIGFQAGQKPAVYSQATPQLNTIVESQGTWPISSGVGACCFGRVWSVSQSDNQTITYSGLLDETDVGSAGAGQINMATIWSNGTDQVTAIFAFNATLVVCGLKHIIMFTDGRGSLLGLDPTQIYVFDEIVGTGVLSQWSVAPVGMSDVVFVGPNGAQSLMRLTQGERSNPTIDLTWFVRDTFLSQITAEAPNTLQGSYNPLTGFYLVNCFRAGTVWCLDQRRRYVNDIGNLCSIITTWAMTVAAQTTTHNNLTYISRAPGVVGLYTGNADQGSTYAYSYLSPWISFSQQGGPVVSVKLKLLKRLRAIVFTGGSANLNLSWAADFGTGDLSGTGRAVFVLGNTGNNSQYGLAQYGVGQYGGGAATSIVNYASRARGQYFQFGVSVIVNSAFALQQIQATLKLGRVAGGLVG